MQPTSSPGAVPSLTPRAALAADAPAQPVRVEAVRTPNVAIVIVTWNRCADVDNVLGALSRQDFDTGSMDVFVIDNASTDGTLEKLRKAWNPDRIVENPTDKAHEPDFRVAAEAGPNAGGFRSLTIVHNSANHGGCGGFNTGFACVEHFLDSPESLHKPDYVWLVDDDVDLPEDALAQLTGAAEADGTIGLVGSRTVDRRDRKRTIETTIYFDAEGGKMGDEPPAGHRLEDSHRTWAGQVGGPKGGGPYEGVREVDVVSACSLLARWSAVREVGFWDHRYFIYCDDADWCLRFGRAGHRVVCNLDAVVYHLPWNLKLTPVRGYYAHRNFVWLLQKTATGGRLRRLTARWLGGALRDSAKAAVMRRLTHAEIIRRTADDITRGKGGKLEQTGPSPIPVQEALDKAGALKPGARIVVICNHPEAIERARRLREHVVSARPGADRADWVELVRSDLPGAGGGGGGGGFERLLYSPSWRSRLVRQLPLLRRPPRAVVVFGQACDVPLLRGRFNVHVDPDKPTMAQLERDGFGPKLRFLLRWTATACRCVVYSLTVRPYVSKTKYG